jgi:hypothetical protein
MTTTQHMRIVWSPHALERAKQRGGTWERFKREVEEKIWLGVWDEYYEYDPRDTRGTVRNLVVRTGDRAGFSYALVRRDGPGVLIIASILTSHQKAFNEANLWARTPELARELHERKRASRTPLFKPLTHSPFTRARLNRTQR